MVFFVYVFLFAYAWGNLSYEPRNMWQQAVLGVARGMVPLVAVWLVNDTGLSMAVAGIGVLLGYSWSPLQRFRERDAVFVALGTLSIFAPLVAVVVASLALLAQFVGIRWRTGMFWGALVLPLLMWQLQQHDIFIIYGVATALLIIYQLVPRLASDNQRQHPGRVKLRRAVLLFLIAFVAFSAFFNRYVYRGFGLQVDIIRQGTSQFRVVALTFDDGPDPLYTPDILDILKEYDVPATFFVVGNHVKQHPDIAQRIVREGHSIGNHTHNHRSLVPLSEEQTRIQILRCHLAIVEATGKVPGLFRPPRGVYSQYARDFLRQLGYTMVLWDVTSQDWAELTPGRIVSNVLGGVQNGSIILLHDSGNLVSAVGGNRINTVLALPAIIEGLRSEGYTFLTMDEMILLTGLTGDEGDID